MNKRQGRSLSRRRTMVISLIVVLVIAGGLFLFGKGDEQAPNLEYPRGVSRDEQVAYLMQQHIVHKGGRPVHSFVLYAENRPQGIVVHEGVGTVGRSHNVLDGDVYYEHGGHWGSLMMYNPEKDVVLAAHLAQAELPYDI